MSHVGFYSRKDWTDNGKRDSHRNPVVRDSSVVRAGEEFSPVGEREYLDKFSIHARGLVGPEVAA